MARINESAFKNWQDGETIKATEYKQEREIIRVAVNDNSDKVDDLDRKVGPGFEQIETTINQWLTPVTLAQLKNESVDFRELKHGYVDFKVDPLTTQLAQIAYNAQQLGIKGDGITDDTTAINNAIQSVPEGATILLPKGRYMTTGAILLNRKITLQGMGEETEIRHSGNGDGVVISTRATIKGIKIVGNVNTSKNGILVTRGSSVIECLVYYFGEYGMKLADENHIVTFYSEKTTLAYNRKGGLFLRSDGFAQKNHLIFRGLYCAKNGTNADELQTPATPTTGHGIYIAGGLGITIEDSVTEYNTGVGLYLDKPFQGTDNYTLRGFTGKNIYYEQNKYTHLFVDMSKGVWRNIDIKGSSYNNPHTYPSNSLIPTEGNIKMISSYFIDDYGFNIDGIYGGVAKKLDAQADLVTKSKGTATGVTLSNGWTGSLFYQRNDLGQVLITGNVIPGTITQGTAIGVLPEGFRPLRTKHPCTVSVGTPSEVIGGVIFETNGNITINNPLTGVIGTRSITVHTIFQT